MTIGAALLEHGPPLALTLLDWRSALCGAAAADVLKRVFRQPRPPTSALAGYGMPSGHAAVAASVSARHPLLALPAAWVGMSRAYGTACGPCHYPGQVAAGVLTGLLAPRLLSWHAVLAVWVAQRVWLLSV
mgnify:CR=1 FL=1